MLADRRNTCPPTSEDGVATRGNRMTANTVFERGARKGKASPEHAQRPSGEVSLRHSNDIRVHRVVRKNLGFPVEATRIATTKHKVLRGSRARMESFTVTETAHKETKPSEAIKTP